MQWPVKMPHLLSISIYVTVTKIQKDVSKSPKNSVTLRFFPASLDLVGTLTFAQSTLVVQRPLMGGYKTIFLLKFLLVTPRTKKISASSQRIWSPLAELLPKREQKYVISNSIFSRVKLTIQPIAPKVVQYHCQTIQITRTPSGLSRSVPCAFCHSRKVP